jgi:hypothetical protein
MSTTVFIHKYSEKKRKYLTAMVVATSPDGSVVRYCSVWSVTLDCGVYVIHSTDTFTLPATNVELFITTED